MKYLLEKKTKERKTRKILRNINQICAFHWFVFFFSVTHFLFLSVENIYWKYRRRNKLGFLILLSVFLVVVYFKNWTGKNTPYIKLFTFEKFGGRVNFCQWMMREPLSPFPFCIFNEVRVRNFDQLCVDDENSSKCSSRFVAYFRSSSAAYLPSRPVTATKVIHRSPTLGGAEPLHVKILPNQWQVGLVESFLVEGL